MRANSRQESGTKARTALEELTRAETEDCTFQGIQVHLEWIVVDERVKQGKAAAGGRGRQQKRMKTVTWKACSPEYCLEDLLQLSQRSQITLTSCYNNIPIASIVKLDSIFDIKRLVRHREAAP